MVVDGPGAMACLGLWGDRAEGLVCAGLPRRVRGHGANLQMSFELLMLGVALNQIDGCISVTSIMAVCLVGGMSFNKLFFGIEKMFFFP